MHDSSLIIVVPYLELSFISYVCLYLIITWFHYSFLCTLSRSHLRPWVCVPRLEIRVTAASESALESHGRFLIGTIHRYFSDLFLLSYLSLFSISVMILTSSAGILVLISCWNSCVYGSYILYWGLTYSWVCFHLAYVRRHNVPVPARSGRYSTKPLSSISKLANQSRLGQTW